MKFVVIKNQKVKNSLFLVMGVSGCGKTTVAKELANTLKIPFIEADDFHPIHNIEKMKKGIPLNDEDRLPWLENLAKELKEKEVSGAVLACSALKKKYRTTLNSLIFSPLQVIFLEGSFEKIQERMKKRQNHFMPADLLRSQFETLEPPHNAWIFDIDNSPSTIHLHILERIKMANQDG